MSDQFYNPVFAEQERHSTLVLEAAVKLAETCAGAQRAGGPLGFDNSLEEALIAVVSWSIDHGFSKKQILTALGTAATSNELDLEGWLSLIESES